MVRDKNTLKLLSSKQSICVLCARGSIKGGKQHWQNIDIRGKINGKTILIFCYLVFGVITYLFSINIVILISKQTKMKRLKL